MTVHLYATAPKAGVIIDAACGVTTGRAQYVGVAGRQHIDCSACMELLAEMDREDTTRTEAQR